VSASPLFALVALDAKIALRHRFVHVAAFMALFFGALARFLAPSGTLVPLLYTADVAMIGFLFGAVMILQDKSFGTIFALRLTPAGALAYVTSKLVVNALLALFATALLTLVALPPSHFSLGAALLAVGTSASVGLVGMGLAVFFPNMSAFFYPMVVVSMVLSMPIGSYLHVSTPGSMLWFLPTYHLLFGARELLLPAGHPEVAREAFAFVSASSVLAAGFCVLAARFRLFSEGR